MQIDKEIRNTYQSEIEEKTGKKVRNCFFIVSGINSKDYYCFQGNGKSILGILEIDMLEPKHRWL